MGAVMNQARSVSAKRPLGIGRWLGAVAEELGRLIEVLGPQPQLKPVPVRVRSGRSRGAR
ncbi:hypothetical protein GCM10007884_35090 [Methylobacterium brachythecii]|uniref:Uncharacterized protein n=2 Tax=Methylobacterium brachythecii TaxID=1176177 RepID=A0ABQ6DB28_9HYPH|nr:hypothetical protein GCM10007884_35090 [Methylobacterium brachythecii]